MGVPGAGMRGVPIPVPHAGGGNIDNRHLTRGATLYLPVGAPGGLFSVGDAHAAQGDGEVAISGLECAMATTYRVGLLKGVSIPAPQIRKPAGPLTPRVDGGGWYATSGIEPDLMTAAQVAVRAMIEHLGRERGLGREDAYILCSLAGDLKITEVVDAPNWMVCLLPAGRGVRLVIPLPPWLNSRTARACVNDARDGSIALQPVGQLRLRVSQPARGVEREREHVGVHPRHSRAARRHDRIGERRARRARSAEAERDRPHGRDLRGRDRRGAHLGDALQRPDLGRLRQRHRHARRLPRRRRRPHDLLGRLRRDGEAHPRRRRLLQLHLARPRP